MGIKICPQCSGKVSDTRNDCPHCSYVFPELKKCPDCEEEIDASLPECPTCGHIFKKEVSEEIAKPSHAVTEETNSHNDKSTEYDEPTCPYCNAYACMEIGKDLYLCATCKGKFVDTRGLPTPQPLKVASEGASNAITQKEFESKKKEILGEAADVSRKPKQISSSAVNKFKLVNKILAITAAVLFIVGAIFLMLVRVQGRDYRYVNFFEYSFERNGTDGLLAFIFGGAYLLCIIPHIMLSLQKNNYALLLIIIGILAVLCGTTSLVCAFVLCEDYSILYAILMCVSCGFLLIQVAITALLALLKSSTVQD